MTNRKMFYSALVAVPLLFGVSQTASAQSAASDSQAVANNLVSQQSTSAASAQVAGLVGAAVSNVVSPPPSPGAPAPTASYDGNRNLYLDSRQMGIAAGENPKAGVWVQGGYTFVDGDDLGGEFDGNVVNFLLGLDYKIRPKMVLGAALGYENLDLDTEFNNGTFKGTGFGVTPYFGMSLTDKWSFQVMAGWTTINYDTSSDFDATTASFDADRYFGSASIVGTYKLTDKIAVAPKLSILHLVEEQDGFTDSAGTVAGDATIDLGRVSFGGTLSYLAGPFVPFVRLSGEYDYEKEDAVNLGNGNFSSDDEAGLNASVGLNMDFANGLSGSLEATSASIFRENLDVYTISGRLRYMW